MERASKDVWDTAAATNGLIFVRPTRSGARDRPVWISMYKGEYRKLAINISRAVVDGCGRREDSYLAVAFERTAPHRLVLSPGFSLDTPYKLTKRFGDRRGDCRVVLHKAHLEAVVPALLKQLEQAGKSSPIMCEYEIKRDALWIAWR